jgi:hypothetical protein
MMEHPNDWTGAFEAIDRAFADAARPEKFTDHPYCDECAEAHEYFSAYTPATLADVTEPPETLGISFLTDEAFGYLLPGMLRWITRTGTQYCVGDVLFHVENRLHALTADQRTALRDLLYVVYERLHDRIHETAFDYPMLWRILNDLDGPPRIPPP